MRRAPLALLIVLAACSSAAPEETDQAGEAILGGTKTRDYPLVGMLRHTTGWNCTGTLIAPDVVLAAAHCIAATVPHGPAYPLQPGVVRVGPAFTFYPEVDANGRFLASVARVVDRVYGFGTGLDATTEQNPDAALFHLATPVERSSYAEVASALPAAGTSLVTVGFGCTSIAAGGYFTKRMRALAWDDLYAGTWGSESGIFTKDGRPGVSCPGDSGGPLASSDGKTIYGVTFGGTATVTGWVNATLLHDAIAAVRFDVGGRACAQGNGAWCSDANGDVPLGYADASPGTEVSAYIVTCRSGRPTAGPTRCACTKAAAGVADVCR